MLPDNDRATARTTPTDEEPLSVPIPPVIAQAQSAFRRDLHQLLQEQPGQWVAYHGGQRVGFGQTKTRLYQECLRRGYEPGHFVVRFIQPPTEEGDCIGPFEIG